MYANNGINNVKIIDHMNDIYISPIPNREGQYLRNLLLDSLYSEYRPNTALYTLNIDKILERKTDLDITKTSNSTRSQLKLTTNISIINIETGEKLLSNKLSSITSYNVLSSQFTTKVSEESARKSALNDLAKQIEMRLALFLRK